MANKTRDGGKKTEIADKFLFLWFGKETLIGPKHIR